MGMAARKQETPPDPSALVSFTFRVPRALLLAIDGAVEHANTADPWRPINRSDFMRNALAEAAERAGSEGILLDYSLLNKDGKVVYAGRGSWDQIGRRLRELSEQHGPLAVSASQGEHAPR